MRDIYNLYIYTNCVIHALSRLRHRLNGSLSHVLTATSHSYGKAKNSTPRKNRNP